MDSNVRSQPDRSRSRAKRRFSGSTANSSHSPSSDRGPHHTELAEGDSLLLHGTWQAIEALTEMTTLHHRPLVVELGTGSGAIAKAISTELTRTDIHAVEISPEAAAYARRNLADTLVELHVGDMATALPELNRTVDLVQYMGENL